MELHYQNLFAWSTAPQVDLYTSASSTRNQSDLLALCYLLISFLTSCFAVESSSVVEVVPTKVCDVCADRLNLRGVMAGALQQTAAFQAQQVFRLDRHDMNAHHRTAWPIKSRRILYFMSVMSASWALAPLIAPATRISLRWCWKLFRFFIALEVALHCCVPLDPKH